MEHRHRRQTHALTTSFRTHQICWNTATWNTFWYNFFICGNVLQWKTDIQTRKKKGPGETLTHNIVHLHQSLDLIRNQYLCLHINVGRLRSQFGNVIQFRLKLIQSWFGTPSWTADTCSNDELPEPLSSSKNTYTKQYQGGNLVCWKKSNKKKQQKKSGWVFISQHCAFVKPPRFDQKAISITSHRSCLIKATPRECVNFHATIESIVNLKILI